MDNFADRLLEAVERKRSHVVVGLDPDYALLPPQLRQRHEALYYAGDSRRRVAAYREFLLGLLPRLAPLAAAVKIQLAYYEAQGSAGYALYEEMVQAAQSAGCLVIADAKRGDIGSTAEAYAQAHLDQAGADALTVNPWFGSDGVEPFLQRCREGGKGVFVLVKTSNPTSAEIQDLLLADGRPVYQQVGELTRTWSRDTLGHKGMAAVGAVVGATHREEALTLRAELPDIPFLIPGYGAQGAGAADLAGLFGPQGRSAVVNSSRAILYAYRATGGDHVDAAVAEAQSMREALWQVAVS
jgi:orotidine-5'-phosphate decarboxylase